MAFKLLDAATAIGAGRSIKPALGVQIHNVDIVITSLAATKISALTVNLQGSETNEDAATGVITTPTLAIGSTAERFSNVLFYYRIDNTNYNKAAVAAGSTFTAAHVIGDGASALWGCIDIYINAAGTMVTKVPLTPQIYTTAALAHAAADAAKLTQYTSDLCYVGRILINSDTTTWTANTDDMTAASDLTTATFLSAIPSFYDLAIHALSAADITAQRSAFHVVSKSSHYIRAFISALTGTGQITVKYTPAYTGGLI